MASVRYVTGPIGSGKTSRLAQWFQEAPPGTAGGILARKRWCDGRPVGYDLVLLPEGAVRPLADLSVGEEGVARRDASGQSQEALLERHDAPVEGRDDFLFGPFRFHAEAFRVAADHLDALAADPEIGTILLDEVGPMELAGGGHAAILRRLLRTDKQLVLCVRTECLEAVKTRFSACP